MAGCKQNTESDADFFGEKIKIGTDSVANKKYDTSNRLIYSSTNYFGAKYETKFSYTENTLETIEGYFLGKLYGHAFHFNKMGHLTSYYYFYGSEKECSYLREYNEEGRLINVKGSPFVDYMIVENNNLKLFFSSAFTDSIYAYATYKNLPEQDIILSSSSMQPMLSEGTIPILDSVLKLRLYWIDKYTKQGQSHYDTLSLNNYE